MSEDTIRVATKNDAEELLELMREAFEPLKNLGIEWPSVYVDLETMTNNIERSTTYVLERDDKIASTITIRFPWEEGMDISGYPFLWWFATKPEYKGQGLGGKLLTYVEETVLRDTLKAPAVVLGTSLKLHPWLKTVYERRGYELYISHDTDYGDTDGLMRKILIPERFDKEILAVPVLDDA
ncbi:GNAT family N-acetyltransferase [Salinicoccus albus]|uniref:GNAT family N-acetyltransferase n=1 Tax=Salinicoccus albus TaxID=418756 RepID=UPI000380C1B3|nr:GNAT family N-acetyltransferase [Salinicoccus albus]